jgi:hypothetical protein
VVRATDGTALHPFAAKQAAAAVPAQVDVSVKPAVAIADDDNALAGNVEHLERTWLGEPVGSSGVEPLIPEDCAPFALEERVVPVGAAGEGDFKRSFGQGRCTPEGFGGLLRRMPNKSLVGRGF